VPEIERFAVATEVVAALPFIDIVSGIGLIDVDMPPTTTASEIPTMREPFGSAGSDKLIELADGTIAVLGSEVLLEPPPPPPQAGNNRKTAAIIRAQRTLAS
jgi:hypothetical protein